MRCHVFKTGSTVCRGSAGVTVVAEPDHVAQVLNLRHGVVRLSE